MMGDGSFGFAVGELETALRLDLAITFLVLANGSYGWIKAGQRSGFGKRYYGVDFAMTDHAAIARAYGMAGWRVEDPAALEGVLAAALDLEGPSLVDIVVQPLEEAKAPVSEWIA